MPKGDPRAVLLLAVAIPAAVTALLSARCEVPESHAALMAGWSKTDTASYARIANFPMTWRLGKLDPRFKMTRTDAVTHIKNAIALWEAEAGRALFVEGEREDAGFPIDFVYDERQERVEAMNESAFALSNLEREIEGLKQQVEALEADLDASEAAHEAALASYEQAVEAYNSRIDEVNARGGASDAESVELEGAKSQLLQQQDSLNALEATMKAQGTEANGLIDRVNQLTDQYNRQVASFNGSMPEESFDLVGETLLVGKTVAGITIFAFESTQDLTVTVAHELGHAMGMDHVKEKGSVMNEAQVEKIVDVPKLSKADKEALREVLRAQ